MVSVSDIATVGEASPAEERHSGRNQQQPSHFVHRALQSSGGLLQLGSLMCKEHGAKNGWVVRGSSPTLQHTPTFPEVATLVVKLAWFSARGLVVCCCCWPPSLTLADSTGAVVGDAGTLEEVRPMADWLPWGGGGGLLRGEAFPLLMSA